MVIIKNIISKVDIGEVLKNATAIKKESGIEAALDYLTSSYATIKQEDIPTLFDKILTYFKKDTSNKKVIDFIDGLISTNILDKFSELLIDYYWLIGDYENYKFSIKNTTSRLNPNSPWEYCFKKNKLQIALSHYFEVKGLENRINAIGYFYSIISAEYFELAGQIMSIGKSNLSKYCLNKKSWNKEKSPFYKVYDFQTIIDDLSNRFFGKKRYSEKCLITLKSKTSNEDFTNLLQNKLYHEFPKFLGISPVIFENYYNDLDSFALSIFNDEDFNDIVILHGKWPSFSYGLKLDCLT